MPRRKSLESVTRVGLVTRYSHRGAIALSRHLDKDLSRRGITVVHDLESAGARNAKSGVPRSQISQLVDLVITLGGDGTLLSVARFPAPGVPILGIDIGTLGFLTCCPPDAYEPVLEECLAGTAMLEKRRLLTVTVMEDGRPPRRFSVVNDAVLSKSHLSRIATIRVDIDGRTVSRYRGDGLIVSTPTGSTAYNLSAGGPILEPTMPAIILSPICPHTLTVRPLVIPDTVKLRLALEGDPMDVFLTLDGQEGLPVTPATGVLIARSSDVISLVRQKQRTFYDVLAEKLSFGGEREGG
jgi:NAD+ kinase